jgi:GTP-binding protein LepA
VERIGVITPKLVATESLGPGEIGFITASIKEVADTRVGDTITEDRRPTAEALPGFKPAQPVVFCGLFPVDAADFEDLRAAMGKLRLNDASFSFEMETSAALGFGFRCGFLGLLHLEIIQERLEREFNLDLIATAPSVVYRMNMTNGDVIELHNPADMPDVVKIASIEEPWIKATILTPDDYLGPILKLCQERRGIQTDLSYVGKRAMVTYQLPLNEVVFDFYDRLKSITKGYASFDYQITGHEPGDLVRMSILVNEEPVDALSMLVHRSAAEKRGRVMCEKLKDLIPRHMFKIPIQAAIGGRVVARETISAMRKDVTAKCYGGDATRKRKLLDKQKAGKKRMRQFGKVEIPAGSLHRGAEDRRLPENVSAANTMPPPRSVLGAGTSACTSQTQMGPKTGSMVEISADTLAAKESDTMTPMPAITARIAPQVTRSTASRRKTTPRRAAISGTPACISRMLATLV